MGQVGSMEVLRKILQNFGRETCLEETERDDSEGVVVEVQINVDPWQAGNFFNNWATSYLMKKDSAPCGWVMNLIRQTGQRLDV